MTEAASNIGLNTETKTYLEDYGDVAAEAFLRRHGIPCVILTTKEVGPCVGTYTLRASSNGWTYFKRVIAVRRIIAYSLELVLGSHEPYLLAHPQLCQKFAKFAEEVILSGM